MLNLSNALASTIETTKKTVSAKKIAANKLNAKKSTGPVNTSITKFNGTKHGLQTVGVSELDNAEGHQVLLKTLMEEKKPVDEVETFLVETAALEMVRARRARRLDSAMHPPIYHGTMPTEKELYKGTLVDEGFLASLDPKEAQPLVSIYQRYESIIFGRLQKTMHELERVQRTRQGEIVPIPETLDVNFHIDGVKEVKPASTVIEQTFSPEK